MDKDNFNELNARLERIEAALGQLTKTTENVPDLMAIGADTADELARQGESRGIDPVERAEAGMSLLLTLSEPETLKNLQSLVKLSNQFPGIMAMGVDSMDEIVRETSCMTEENLAFVIKATEAVTEANSEPPPKVGLFGMLSALSDPDRQKALGHILNILKKLGKKL
ncbi:MAG: DUF1641 domain-containing protein [Saprospiraceae bacterium]|nr:DUF1641 domain-containing protein [Saprospiraceae bacterium]